MNYSQLLSQKYRSIFLFLSLLLFLELLLTIIYASSPNIVLTDPLVLVYPFIWINVGIMVVILLKPTSVTSRKKVPSVFLGVVYFCILSYFSSILTFGHSFHGHVPSDHNFGFGIVILSIPPGWAPALFYTGNLISVYVFFFQLVGYLSLSYLVYRSVLQFNKSALSGLFGIFSCVSCTWPLVGTYIGGISGISFSLIMSTHQSYGISTLVFVSIVLLLFFNLPKREF